MHFKRDHLHGTIGVIMAIVFQMSSVFGILSNPVKDWRSSFSVLTFPCSGNLQFFSFYDISTQRSLRACLFIPCLLGNSCPVDALHTIHIYKYIEYFCLWSADTLKALCQLDVVSFMVQSSSNKGIPGFKYSFCLFAETRQAQACGCAIH